MAKIEHVENRDSYKDYEKLEIRPSRDRKIKMYIGPCQTETLVPNPSNLSKTIVLK